MSLLVEKEIACPHCQYPNMAEVWSTINGKEDPELKEMLLGGEINMVECASCRQVFYSEHFLIYHDPSREMMAFVYPYRDRTERSRWEEETKKHFEASQDEVDMKERLSYGPVSFFGLDELVRYIEADEEMQIQSEIVSVISHEQGFSVKPLGAFYARSRGIPAVVPLAKGIGLSSHAAALKALETIERLNNRLSVYAQFRSNLQKGPELVLPGCRK